MSIKNYNETIFSPMHVLQSPLEPKISSLKDRLDMLFCFFSRDEENAHPISCFKMTFFWTSFLRKLKRLRPSTAQNIEFHGMS